MATHLPASGTGATRPLLVPPMTTESRRWLIRLLIALLLASSSGGAVLADRETQVKAAFVYRFLSFVDVRPSVAESNRPWLIGVLAREPAAESLSQLVAGKTLKGLSFSIVSLVSPAGSRDCDMVFVDATNSRLLPQVMREISGKSVLVVGEGTDFVRRGGMIALVEDGDVLRFEVNLAAGEKAGVKFSSQLLKLARKIITE